MWNLCLHCLALHNAVRAGGWVGDILQKADPMSGLFFFAFLFNFLSYGAVVCFNPHRGVSPIVTPLVASAHKPAPCLPPVV
jgi:hypothetical protein